MRYVERKSHDVFFYASSDLGIFRKLTTEQRTKLRAYSLCTGEVPGIKIFAPINIIVHYPETEEGWRELRRRVAGVHADGVLNSISKLDCPIREKERLLNAIIKDTKEQIKAEHKKQSEK